MSAEDFVRDAMGGLTSFEIRQLGEKYSIKTTIDDPDIIPISGLDSSIEVERASTGEPSHLVDFFAGIGANPFGYPGGQFLMFPGNEWFNAPSVVLKRELCRITPGAMNVDKKAFLSNSGTEAVEAAIKMCLARRFALLSHAENPLERQRVEGRKVFCAFGGAFHGRTGFSLSLNCSKQHHTEGYFLDEETPGDLSVGLKVKRRAIPVRHLPFPEVGDTKLFDDIFDQIPWDDTLAIFIELVQGEGGIKVIDGGCLNRLVAKCREMGVYIVVDEVQTGMMRTGKMFACDHFDLIPDIICLSKALGGGETAIGATIARAEFDFERQGRHSNTFGGSPRPCEAALRNIDKLENLDMTELRKKILLLGSISRGLGLMRRIKFETPNVRDEVCRMCVEKGLLVIPAGESALRLMPPLNIDMTNLLKGIQILKKCISKVLGTHL